MNKKFISFVLFLLILSLCGCNRNSKIDRFSLVTRHNITNTSIDSLNSLSVGNGGFAFTVDITGLQTFPEFYSRGISLGTMSDWGIQEIILKTLSWKMSIKLMRYMAERLIMYISSE
jgi:hypothetical protein